MVTPVDKENFFENYYNSLYDEHFRSFHNERLSLLRITLVILLRVGFVLTQVGSVPVNNVNLILLQNVIDICWVTTIYLLIGFIIAYNGDVAGLIGEGYWIGHPEVDENEAVVGWSAVVIASAICTCGIVGRTHTVGYLVIGFLLSGLVQPLLIHWAWTQNGWMKKNALGGRDVEYRDYAGSGVVHLAGGLSGLIGCTTLGRRILKLKDIDDASVSGSSGTAFAGQLLIFLGLQILSMPHLDRKQIKGDGHPEHLPDLYINNLLAASSCCLFVVALHFVLSRDVFNHWTVMRCVQAAISGLVTVSAGTDAYSPEAAIGLGCLGGAVFYVISRQVFHSAIEDYCNITAIHFACAVLGSILAPLCGVKTGQDSLSVLLNFSWQMICLIVLVSFVTIIMTTAFLVLQLFGILRNRSEHLNHLRAIVALERSPGRSCVQRLFFPGTESVYLQPGSLAGSSRRPNVDSRFWKYKTEIDETQLNASGEQDNITH